MNAQITNVKLQQQKPIFSAPSTGGETPVPIEYTATAIDPLYSTPANPYTDLSIGGSTYTQTGGLLSILESAEQAQEFQRQVEVQRAVQKTIQEESQPAPKADNTQMIVFLAIGLLVGYFAHPMLKQWI